MFHACCTCQYAHQVGCYVGWCGTLAGLGETWSLEWMQQQSWHHYADPDPRHDFVQAPYSSWDMLTLMLQLWRAMRQEGLVVQASGSNGETDGGTNQQATNNNVSQSPAPFQRAPARVQESQSLAQEQQEQGGSTQLPAVTQEEEWLAERQLEEAKVWAGVLLARRCSGCVCRRQRLLQLGAQAAASKPGS